MEVHKTSEKLPEEGRYVLCHHTRGTWQARDQEGCEWVVLCLRLGISIDERQAMDDCERKNTWKSADEYANNHKPYCWDEFGPDSFFGQDVDMWCELPRGLINK